MPSTTLARGNIGTGYLVSVSLTPTSVTNGVSAEQTFTVAGLQAGDEVNVSLNAAWTSLTTLVTSRVTAANTLGISFQNNTAGALTPPAGTYIIAVNRPEFLPLPANLG